LLTTVLLVPVSQTAGATSPDPSGNTAGGRPKFRLRDLMPRLDDYLSAFSLMAIPSVLFVVIVSAFRISSANIQSSFYVVYLSDIGMTGTLIGLLISISQGMASLGTLAAGKRVRRFDLHWIMLITVSLSLFLISITPLLGTVFAVLMMFIGCRGFFQGMSQPVMYSILSTAVGPGNQGTSIGLRSTANRLSSIIFPVVMGAIAEVWGIGTSFLIMGAAILAMLGVTGIWLTRGKGFNRVD
ncbi:MAG: MFS transporter, partial [Alphaproteobacteria bacterium]